MCHGIRDGVKDVVTGKEMWLLGKEEATYHHRHDDILAPASSPNVPRGWWGRGGSLQGVGPLLQFFLFMLELLEECQTSIVSGICYMLLFY